MKTKAFTLMEILISVSIIAILSAILYFALAPTMRLKGIQANITSDLRQLSAALNLYMANNDDGFPAHDITFFYDKRGPGRKPVLPHKVPKSWCIPACPQSTPTYFLNVGVWSTRIEKYYGERLKHPFTPTTVPVITARFHRRDLGSKVMVEAHNPETGQSQLREDNGAGILAAYLEGSVRWERLMTAREEELSFIITNPLWYQ